MTTHNRKEKTIRCLTSLMNCDTTQIELDVFLVDDASNDGTSSTIKEKFPKVHVFEGSGNLFWCRGMRLAWQKAIDTHIKYDYFMWLNDDTELFENAIKELLDCCMAKNNKTIVSGFIKDRDEKEAIYGGSDKNKKLLSPNGKFQEITYMNGNVVLIPFNVYERIGIFDPYLHHDLGDVDYGLSCLEAGFYVISSRYFVGQTEQNQVVSCRVRCPHTNMVTRFKKLYSPLGSNPFINFHFRKKHFGLINAISYFLYLYIINILPDCIIETFTKKYAI